MKIIDYLAIFNDDWNPLDMLDAPADWISCNHIARGLSNAKLLKPREKDLPLHAVLHNRLLHFLAFPPLSLAHASFA